MLLGIWKNFGELEENISIEELEALIEAAHDREFRQQQFAAALKGINIDDPKADDIKERFEKVERRARARLTGKSTDALEYEDLDLDIETD